MVSRSRRVNERISLCWLRRDLRIEDSAALNEATCEGRSTAVVYVWDDGILSKIGNRQNRRVSFIHRSLRELQAKLQGFGSDLIVLRGHPLEEIPRLASSMKAESVVWGEDYDPGAIKRDEQISKELSKIGVQAVPVKDIVIFHKDDLKSQTGNPFRVYTPYSKAWYAKFQSTIDAANHGVDHERLIPKKDLPKIEMNWELSDLGFDPVDLWLEAGEDAAQRRLREFSKKIARYGEGRDFPALNLTSHLSVDFRFGTLSIRAAVRESLKHDNPGAKKWLAELIWRDFYQDILFHYPEVVNEPFQPEYRSLKYPGLQSHWELWRDGQTGYPIVDAAMRCLNQTGYMHNRLRMVVASFLSKDLLLEYKQGEHWFARELLDYELASNNGGWQWASSVGCDPQPYFRIFNPILQSKKFDAEGAFIREWVPELKELPNELIHFPSSGSDFDLEAAGVRLGSTYPHPCVDHSMQRDRAVALLESAKKAKT